MDQALMDLQSLQDALNARAREATANLAYLPAPDIDQWNTWIESVRQELLTLGGAVTKAPSATATKSK
jgi:hypothetical protein